MTVIAEAIDALQTYLRHKAEALYETESLLRSSEQLQTAFNHRQLALVRHALGHPGARYTIEGHRQSHNIVYQTARTDLLGLVDLRMLVKQKMGRSFVFLNSPSLRDRLGNL